MVRTEPSRLQKPSASELQRQRDLDQAVRASIRYGFGRTWARLSLLVGEVAPSFEAAIRRRYRLYASGRDEQGRFTSKSDRVHAALAHVVRRG